MQTGAHLLAGTCRLVLDRFDVDSNCRLETLAAEGTKKKDQSLLQVLLFIALAASADQLRSAISNVD